MEPEQIILDTDVFIELLDSLKDKHSLVLNTMQKFEQQHSQVFLTAITKMELVQGVKNKSEIKKLLLQISGFENIELSSGIGDKAFELIVQYSKSHSLKIPDALIAATCLLLDIPLFTFNIRHYKFIKGLKLYQP